MDEREQGRGSRVEGHGLWRKQDDGWCASFPSIFHFLPVVLAIALDCLFVSLILNIFSTSQNNSHVRLFESEELGIEGQSNGGTDKWMSFSPRQFGFICLLCPVCLP
jgi:hypothetical protein